MLLDSWLRGLKHRSTKPTNVKAFPGFESLTVRHIALVLFLTLPAHAHAISDIGFLKNYTNIVYNGKYCTINKTWYAVYLPLANEIQLCQKNIRNTFPKHEVDSRITSALRHEAVHLAQDCKAGIDNKKMQVLNELELGPIPTNVVMRYEVRRHKIEAEAWKHQDSNMPYKLVDKYCSRK